ncbi:translation initiation factor IF-2-like [Lynx canadensis]|uniref:translation initiation factor IF-2-like n=1 Tax=Lynx canadensis TaxID=61383 RepID=UPI0011B0EF7D|nr:translation initiation factor IF-2-like [Lynx canadensis]
MVRDPAGASCRPPPGLRVSARPAAGRRLTPPRAPRLTPPGAAPAAPASRPPGPRSPGTRRGPGPGPRVAAAAASGLARGSARSPPAACSAVGPGVALQKEVAGSPSGLGRGPSEAPEGGVGGGGGGGGAGTDAARSASRACAPGDALGPSKPSALRGRPARPAAQPAPGGIRVRRHLGDGPTFSKRQLGGLRSPSASFAFRKFQVGEDLGLHLGLLKPGPLRPTLGPKAPPERVLVALSVVFTFLTRARRSAGLCPHWPLASWALGCRVPCLLGLPARGRSLGQC